MKNELAQRLAALNDEIRHYPTPIARCDLHLPALLEERAGLLALLNKDEKPAGGCTPAASWVNDGGFDAA